MTLILGTLDTVSNEVRYIRAGHPELIIFDHSQNRARLLVNSKGTIPVGWMDNYNVTEEDEEVFFLKDDETVYLYSDGLFECNRPDGERLGQDSLVQQMNSKIPQTQALTSSLEFMQYIRELGYDIRQDDFTMVSFFKPSYSTIPDLKQYFQANIPDDTDMVQIQCSDFLFEMTADMQFALAVENDFNELFYSGSLQWQSSFISGFMLLLAYQNGYIEVKFWFRSILHQMELGREIDACELPNEININHKLNQLSIKKNNYLVKVYFKYLGDIVQVTCLLNPLANTKKGSN